MAPLKFELTLWSHCISCDQTPMAEVPWVEFASSAQRAPNVNASLCAPDSGFWSLVWVPVSVGSHQSGALCWSCLSSLCLQSRTGADGPGCLFLIPGSWDWESHGGGHCHRKVMFVSYFQAKISSVSSFTWLWVPSAEESQCCAFNLGHSRRVLWEEPVELLTWRCQASCPYLISNSMTHSVLRPHD